MKLAVIASALTFLLLYPITCPAQDPLADTVPAASTQPDAQPESAPGSAQPVQKLDEVVVTATRVPTPAKELPVPVQVISRKDIQESGTNDLSEILTEYLPDHFQKYPGALSSVSIRGFSSDTTGTDIKGHVLVLIDGHRAGTGNVAEIPLENVERIEIVRGPGSVVYGSAAMGGVINVITRKGQGAPSAEAGAEYGSNDYVKGHADFSSGFLDNKVGLSVAGRSISEGSYYAGNGVKVPNSGYNDQAYSASLFAAPTPEHTFFAVGDFYHAWDIGTPNPTYMTPDLVDNKDITRWYGSLDYEGYSFDRSMNWQLSYYRVSDQNQWNYPEATYGYTAATTEQDTQGIRSQFSLPTFSLGRLLLGFDWDGIDVTSFTNPTGYPWSPDCHYDDYAVFAEEKIDWNRFVFLFGVRYDYFQEQLLPTEGLQIEQETQQFGHTCWRAGLTYQFTDWLRGRLAAGSAFSIPSSDELAGRFQSSEWMKVVGNPNLKPETSTTYEAGLDGDFAGLKPSLTFFYTDYTNKITGGFPACVDGDCSWTTYENVDGAILSAFEGALTYKKSLTCDGVQVALRPFVNFTYYTQRELEDKNYSKLLKSDIVPYVPLWDVTGGIEATFNHKVTFLFTGFYTGDEQQENYNYLSPTYSQAVDKNGFVVLSARLSYRPVKYLELFVASDNLTDKYYAFVDGYPMPGRTFRGGFQARF